jgi:hypothetical protein
MPKHEGAKLDAHIRNAVILVAGPAKHRAYLRVGVPIAIGFAIVFFHKFIDAKLVPHWAEVVNHLGIAFLVSGIVVFGYEWRSEQKNLMALTAKLSNLLDKTDRMAVQSSLANIAGEDGYRFGKYFLSLADSIARLSKAWTGPSYRAFLAHYLEELTDKAAGLADMSEKLQRKAIVVGSEFRLLMPDASKLIDVLVETTMRELLRHKGEYYAVSDASTWARLTAFGSAHREAWESGRVQMKRIFVLGRDSDLTIDPKVVHDILNSHFEQARTAGNHYEMKVTSEDEYQHLRAIPELNGAVHFGIWVPEREAPIAVFAIDDNFSNFRIAPAPPEMIHGFDSMWARLDDLSGKQHLGEMSKVPIGDAILTDYLLAYRVKRLGHGAHYRGISKMAMWRDGGMKRFFETSRDAIRTKELHVKRIFVLDKPEDRKDRHVLEVIRAHAQVEAETMQKNLYQWRICLRKDLPPELKPSGIAMFEDDGDTGHVLSEVAVSAVADTPAQVDAKPQTYANRKRAFDDFWDTLDRETAILMLFRTCSDEVLEIIANPGEEAAQA